jgi:hypothetical protein
MKKNNLDKMNILRKRIKHSLVDLDLDGRGNYALLAKSIGVNQSSLSMAMTGFRATERSLDILNKLDRHLRQAK